jgi:hypothetical protein
MNRGDKKRKLNMVISMINKHILMTSTQLNKVKVDNKELQLFKNLLDQ